MGPYPMAPFLLNHAGIRVCVTGWEGKTPARHLIRA